MPNYRRNFVPGGTFFFTLVTHERRPILDGEEARNCLRRAMLDVRKNRPFDLIAMVLLPDHLHSVWAMPPEDMDYSIRWAQIKEGFTRHFLRAGGVDGKMTTSRSGRRERAVWQRRFWEHTCRDEDDLRRCVDYLPWNPVKHGLARAVREYPWSTFHRFVREGEYDPGWGGEVSFPGTVGTGWD